MANIKKALLKGDSGHKHELSDYESKYVRDLNSALSLHTLRSQIISGYLTYIATTRLGYTKIPEGFALQYEIDPKDYKILIVTMVPLPKEG